MKIHHLSENNSILNHFLAQIRDVNIQKDSMRFRKNIERIGEIMSYEISKEMEFYSADVQTPLGIKNTNLIKDSVVLCTILRAGLAFHNGFLNYFDNAENGFISAFRHHPDNDANFEIVVQYHAAPSLENKYVILSDPMLATGQSIIAVYEQFIKSQKTKEIHIAVVLAAPEGIELLKENLPDNCHLWIGSIDEKLNDKFYIVPGLGDAGDLAYGTKL